MTLDNSSQAFDESDKPRLDKGKGKATDNTPQFNYTERPVDNTSEAGPSNYPGRISPTEAGPSNNTGRINPIQGRMGPVSDPE